MYGNYQYSLTSEQQSAMQVFLRLIPESVREKLGQIPLPGMDKAYEMLHNLTYANNWTETPEFAVGTTGQELRK